MTVIRMMMRHSRPGPFACPEPGAVPTGLDAWPADQLWLSDACGLRPVQARMAHTVKAATDAARMANDDVVPAHELLMVLQWTRKSAAALRLSARVLRGPCASATAAGRNLAATALLLAATQHNDLLAAVEFSAEVTGWALAPEGGLPAAEPSLPPGIRSVGQLAGRMRRRARDVLGARLSWPDMDTVGDCLERALADDPLRRTIPASQAATP